MNEIDKELGKRLLYFDGGMGTLLQGMGLSGGERPETWNLSHPDRILDVHRRYLEAGCDICDTNTFGCNPPSSGRGCGFLHARGCAYRQRGRLACRARLCRRGYGGRPDAFWLRMGICSSRMPSGCFRTALPLPSKKGRICF